MQLPKFLTSNKWGRRVDWMQLVRSYREIPSSVLADLADYCGAVADMPLGIDAVSMARLVGRQDVWRHIQHHFGLTEIEVYALLKGEPIAAAREKFNVS